MKIAFFETKPEEREFFASKLKTHEVDFYEGTINEALKESAEYEAISLFVHSKLDEEVLNKLPKLRYVQTRSTGYEHIVCRSLYERGILASNVAGYGGPAVAEFAFSLLLNATRRTYIAIERAKEGRFEYHDLKGMELFGKRVGILGLGTIGSQIARIAKGIGMEISAWSRRRRDIVDELGIEFLTELEELLQKSDVIMVALPLTPSTRNLINKKNISKVKKDSIIVNVARAEIIEKELYKEVENTLCLDVISDIKQVARHNIIYTPHMAYYTKEALERIMEISLANMEAFLEGKPLPNCLKIACEREYRNHLKG